MYLLTHQLHNNLSVEFLKFAKLFYEKENDVGLCKQAHQFFWQNELKYERKLKQNDKNNGSKRCMFEAHVSSARTATCGIAG